MSVTPHVSHIEMSPLKSPPRAHRIGRRGEDAAVGLVVDRGWRVIARNRRMARGEADIVALRAVGGVAQGLIAEVKSSARSGEDLGARVNADKRRRMFEMADQLLAEETLEEVHVAIITVQLGADCEELLWLDLDRF